MEHDKNVKKKEYAIGNDGHGNDEKITIEDEVDVRWQDDSQLAADGNATGMWGDRMTAAVTSGWGKRAPLWWAVARWQLREMSATVILLARKQGELAIVLSGE